MIRHQTRALMLTLLKQKASYSTAIKPEENPEPLILKLSKEYSYISYIKKVVDKTEVKNIHFSEWKSRINMLKSYAFTDKQCFQMISRYPLLLQIPIDSFHDTIETWFHARLGFDNFKSLLYKNPELLSVEAVEIQNRVPILHSLFKNSNALAKLLINSPNVMIDNWSWVLFKINYLSEVRKFKMYEVAEACALSKSMELLKFRLDLLEKCGIYKQEDKPVHKINKYDTTRHKNPHLKWICLTNTADFSKLANITTEEYATCRDLYMKYDGEDKDEFDGSESYRRSEKV